MNKSIKHIVLFVSFWFFSNLTFSQFINDQIGVPKPRTKKIVMKTSPVLFFIGQLATSGEYRLSTEIAVDNNSSFQIGMSYVGKSLLIIPILLTDHSNANSFSLNGYRLQATYKLYPFGNRVNAPEGFFVGPHISFTQITYREHKGSPKYNTAQFTYFNGAIKIGYQFIIKQTFAIEIFQGVGVRQNYIINPLTKERFSIHNDPDYVPFPGILKLYFGANFGYNF